MISPGGVLLLNPRMSRPGKARLPLSLLHLGAVLEGRRSWRIIDGNVEPDFMAAVLSELSARPYALVGVTVMPGPQVAPAIEVSSAVRAGAREMLAARSTGAKGEAKAKGESESRRRRT